MSISARLPEPTAPDQQLDADWWRQAVVYQIYPRSFADANGDGIGDLPGIASQHRLPRRPRRRRHLAEPVLPVGAGRRRLRRRRLPRRRPRLGTLDDFDEHGRRPRTRPGIKVIVDIVPNHTSNRHAWFQEALAAEPGSPARDRYIFRDGTGPDGAEPPSDWRSHFGGRAWTPVPRRSVVPATCSPPSSPTSTGTTAEVREDFLTTLRFWADRGVDGFRVDVAHALAKDLSEPLRSQPTLDAERSCRLDGTAPAVRPRRGARDLRRVARRSSTSTTRRGWRWPRPGSPPSAARPLRHARTGLGQAFNFDLLQGRLGRRRSSASVITDSLAEAAESGASSTWVLSNHDVVRHATRYGLPDGHRPRTSLAVAGGSEPAGSTSSAGLRRARAATLLMLALPGSAYLYQGEELGLHEVADLPPTTCCRTRSGRGPGAEKGRDGCRVPLPWTRRAARSGSAAAPPTCRSRRGSPTTLSTASRETPTRRSSSTARPCTDAADLRDGGDPDLGGDRQP